MQLQLWLTRYGVEAYGKGRGLIPEHIGITNLDLGMETEGWVRLEVIEVNVAAVSREQAAVAGLQNLEKQEAALRERFDQAMQALNASRQEFLALPFESK